MRFLWKIGGEAGFGIKTTGIVLAKIANRLGYFSFDYTEYPSLVRGGHNSIEVLISDKEVNSSKEIIDYLVCLNEEAYKLHKKRLAPNSIVIYDKDDFDFKETVKKVAVPFNKIIESLSGKLIMRNTVALGASLALFGVDVKELKKIINEQFAKKGKKVIEINERSAQKGFDYVLKNYSQEVGKILVNKKSKERKLVVTGNEAFSLGSVLADCRLYCAYPMTPASSVLSNLASWQEKVGMVVRHSEDEISVVNTAIGGAFAGVRSAVGTSGGGFALMTESISLAGVTETPLVIFLAQRAGPATGMPTWTEQGDLLFAVHGGHGEFPKIVLAPGDVGEMFTLTAKAFNLADIYQTPVIILSDTFLSESHKSLLESFVQKITKNYQIRRGKTVLKPSSKNYLRYRITNDGISERLIPGYKNIFYQANSYEHLENSHTTEDKKERIAQVDKRSRKIDTYLKKDFKVAKVYGDLKEGGVVFVSWGSTKGPIIEAQKILSNQGKKTAFLHFTHLYPLDEEKIKFLFKKNKKYVLVENNSSGQLGRLLREEAGIEIKKRILKYNGRPFYPEEIIRKLKI